MRTAGYTLAEMLVALFIVGLTASGLTAAMSSLGRLQGSASQSLAANRALRHVADGLDGLLKDQGPFASGKAEDFQGVAAGFSFPCGGSTACGAMLAPAGALLTLHVTEPGGSSRIFPLPGVTAAQFAYAGSLTVGPVWPTVARDLQSLQTVSLLAESPAGETAIAVVRIWPEQNLDCQFDAIARSCREQTP